MTTRSILRLVALGFAMFLVLEALSSASFVLVDAQGSPAGVLYLAAAIPVIGAAVMASILYLYSGRVPVESGHREPLPLLQAGIKLFGVYLAVKSIPYIVGGVFSGWSTMDGGPIGAATYQSLSIGMIYALIGCALFFKGRWLARMVADEDGSP